MTLRFNVGDYVIQWTLTSEPRIGIVKESGEDAKVLFMGHPTPTLVREREQFDICNDSSLYNTLVRSGVARRYKKFPKFKIGDMVEIFKTLRDYRGQQTIYKKSGIVIDLDSTKLLAHVYLQEDMKYVWAPIPFTKKV